MTYQETWCFALRVRMSTRQDRCTNGLSVPMMPKGLSPPSQLASAPAVRDLHGSVQSLMFFSGMRSNSPTEKHTWHICDA